MDLKLVALVIWACTAGMGCYLLGIWLSHGGLWQQATRITAFPVTLILAHPVLATIGLAFWVSYIQTGGVLFAWLGFGVLSASVMLGFMMLTRWLSGRGGKHARGAGQAVPAPLAVLHGAVGLITFALVLVIATTTSSR